MDKDINKRIENFSDASKENFNTLESLGVFDEITGMLLGQNVFIRDLVDLIKNKTEEREKNNDYSSQTFFEMWSDILNWIHNRNMEITDDFIKYIETYK